MNAREEILARVRAALAATAPASPEPDPAGQAVAESVTATETGEADIALLAERLADYRATVHRCDPADLGAAVAAALAGSSQVVVPADLPEQWLTGYPGRVVRDTAGSPVPASELDRPGTTVVTGCAVAVAETGTIMLDGGRRQGRRALTLVPDHHVCVVRADQVVRSVPAALARLTDSRRPLTLISGPSATSDIELNRVEGVHGPRRLEVVLVDAPPR